MNSMRSLGNYIAAVEHGYNPERLPFIKAAADVWDRSGQPAAKLLFKAARDLLVATGRGTSAPAFHLHFLSKSADWNLHANDVSQHVAQLLETFYAPTKQAGARDVVGAVGTLGRGALLGSAGLGAGLGSLYWLLSRHANQDDADIESMQKQVDYYHSLSKELEDSMRRKYRYDRHATNPAPGQPAVAA